MAYSLKKIVDEIIEYIEKRGGNFQSWYVDVSADPERKLFNDHKVNAAKELWIVKETGNELNARNTVNFIITEFGTDGGTKDEAGKYIYAYRKTAATNP
jgi:hypothetical protein